MFSIARPRSVDIAATSVANQHIRTAEDRFLAVLITICTNRMRGYARLHSRLYCISERAHSSVFQFVTLLLCFPCFHLSNLFFKITYALQKRRALLLSRKNAALGFYEPRGRSTAGGWWGAAGGTKLVSRPPSDNSVVTRT